MDKKQINMYVSWPEAEDVSIDADVLELAVSASRQLDVLLGSINCQNGDVEALMLQRLIGDPGLFYTTPPIDATNARTLAMTYDQCWRARSIVRSICEDLANVTGGSRSGIHTDKKQGTLILAILRAFAEYSRSNGSWSGFDPWRTCTYAQCTILWLVATLGMGIACVGGADEEG